MGVHVPIKLGQDIPNIGWVVNQEWYPNGWSPFSPSSQVSTNINSIKMSTFSLFSGMTVFSMCFLLHNCLKIDVFTEAQCSHWYHRDITDKVDTEQAG
jgi:hypothetical protein